MLMKVSAVFLLLFSFQAFAQQAPSSDGAAVRLER
jgi:hypothetical protein